MIVVRQYDVDLKAETVMSQVETSLRPLCVFGVSAVSVVAPEVTAEAQRSQRLRRENLPGYDRPDSRPTFLALSDYRFV